jgi:hypothetical protein
LFTVTPTRENRCRGFYRQGVGSLLESVIMYAVEVAEAGGPEVLTYVKKQERVRRILHCASRSRRNDPNWIGARITSVTVTCS